MSGLKRGGFEPAQNDIEMVAERPLGFGRLQIKPGYQSLPGFFVGDGLKDRIKGKKRIAGKIHLRNQAGGEGWPENRKVNVRRPPGIFVVLPWISTGLDSYELIRPIFVRQSSACAAEVRVQWRRMIITIVTVSSAGIGLPNLNQCMRDGSSVVIENASAHNNSLAQRLACMLPCEIVITFTHRFISKNRPCNFRQRMWKHHQRFLRRAADRGA